MGSCLSSSNIETRGTVKIIYSSTTGTSKKAAFQLLQILQQNKYITSVTNIGDINNNDLLLQGGTVIFMLATYGSGDSPSDGQQFLKWIQHLQPQDQFVNLNYSILAFGNSTFPVHCGFGLRTEKVIKNHGGKELLELTKCDAASKDRDVDAQFPKWSKKLVEVLNSKFQIKQIKKISLAQSYNVTLQNLPNFNWQESASNRTNLSKQFSTYLNMHQCKVIHIKEMRNDISDGRSTLWVRLEISKHIHLTPACNVDVFPLNQIQTEPNDQLVATFSELNGKIPFPPMSLAEIRKRVNLTQNATKKQIKDALNFATSSQRTKKQYSNIVQSKEDPKIQCKKVVQDLKPKIQFLPELGLNNVRTYTLSSWDTQSKYLDLCVSLVKNGLTSNYLKTHPDFVRINPIKSTFTIPQNRPIVMIANGSGIAPFRSIAQYCSSLPATKRISLRLYYGIQNEDIDFYFGDEWKQLQKKGIVQLRIAESRKSGKKKEYVQDVLNKDAEWLSQHLLARNGVIFVCGGLSMSKSINEVIIQSLIVQQKTSEKAASLLLQMKQNKTIVEQVYG